MQSDTIYSSQVGESFFFIILRIVCRLQVNYCLPGCIYDVNKTYNTYLP